jgi:hypothetical protein
MAGMPCKYIQYNIKQKSLLSWMKEGFELSRPKIG